MQSDKKNSSGTENQILQPVQKTWLMPNLIVKIVTRKVGDQYLNTKCKIIKIDSENNKMALCKPLNSNELIKIHEAHLETVLPAIGKSNLMILSGKYRASTAKILKLDQSNFNCTVQITQGVHKDLILDNVGYDSICKFES